MKIKFLLYFMGLIGTSITTFIPMTAKAQFSLTTPGCVREPEAYIPAGTLAMMAYRGAFKQEGIPSYEVLETEFGAGKITAEGIVEAAVKGCFLSNKYGIGEHPNYIKEVKEQMQLLIEEDDS
jgi:hypothetical protein